MSSGSSTEISNGHGHGLSNGHGKPAPIIVDAAELKKSRGVLRNYYQASSNSFENGEADPPGSPIGPRTGTTPGMGISVL